MPTHAGVARTCSAYTLPVHIADPGPADQTMWGQLCYPGTARPKTVQLLVHGAFYNHPYWDFPVGNGYYSYVDAALAAGYATFNVDRVGAGQSSKFANSGLDAGYFTTLPGTRNFFYDPATTDPGVLAADEVNKDVAAVAPGPAPTTPYDITVPVLLVNGAGDQALCPAATEYNCNDPASVMAFESQFYLPQAPPRAQDDPGYRPRPRPIDDGTGDRRHHARLAPVASGLTPRSSPAVRTVLRK
jgi:hypothetical protein